MPRIVGNSLDPDSTPSPPSVEVLINAGADPVAAIRRHRRLRSLHRRSKSLPAKINTMAEPRFITPGPPSEEEVRCYYVGLPGKPRLVARSSTEPWSPQTDFSHTRGKTLDPVGQHPIVAVWNDTAGPLRRNILETLGSIQWVAIDILRLGYQNVRGTLDESPINPVTVLVSVVPGSTTWNAGVTVVLQCRGILRRHGIHDVEVEMKESTISRCNLEPQSAQEPQKLTSGPITQPEEWNALFSEFLGLSIAPLDSPGHEGTKGLYLRIRGTARILLLTCRHVAFVESDGNEDFHHCDAAPRVMIQPGNGTLRDAREDVRIDIGRSEQDIEENRDLPWASAVRKFNEAMAEKAAGEALEQRLGALEEPSTRTIGHVLFSPKISEGRSPSGEKRCRDWALVELDQEKHESILATLTNRVFCGMAGKNDTWRATKAELKGFNQAQHYKLKFDNQTHTIELRGTVAKNTMVAPPTESVSLQEPALVVALHGRTTGLSIGVANEVKSVTRNPIGDLMLKSEEWCILGAKWRSGCGRGPFSGKGDSGSCVWDMEGRVGGMLTAGLGDGSGVFDVSYVSPIEWLLEDIRQESGLDVELA